MIQISTNILHNQCVFGNREERDILREFSVFEMVIKQM